jgi:hypothetical protein
MRQKFTRKVNHPVILAKQQSPEQEDLKDRKNIFWDVEDSQSAKLVATAEVGNTRKILNKSLQSAVSGGTYRLAYWQDEVGGRDLTFDSKFIVVGELDLDPNALTIIELSYEGKYGRVELKHNKSVEVDTSNLVNLDGDQTITGVKTFEGQAIKLLSGNSDFPLVDIGYGNDALNIGYRTEPTNPGSRWGTIAIGKEAGRNSTDEHNIFVGENAGTNDTGFYNINIGNYAGYNNTSSKNVLIGSDTGSSNKGYQNVIIGDRAGFYNEGSYTVGLGINALDRNLGNRIIGLGENVGSTNTGNDVIAIGENAASENKGNRLIAIGKGAGGANTGEGNIGIGDNTLSSKVLDTANAAVVVDETTDVDIANNVITIVGHNLGVADEQVEVRYASTGDPFLYFPNPFDCYLTIVDANTFKFTGIEALYGNGSGVHSFTPFLATNNVVAIGDGAQATGSDQVVLGNSATKEVTTNGVFKTEATIGDIDAVGNKALVTKEYLNTNPIGASGSFTTMDGKTVTVTNGLITAIV